MGMDLIMYYQELKTEKYKKIIVKIKEKRSF